jgi:hypothetical protein
MALVAASLNVTQEQLRTALGDPSQGCPDLAVAATQLGVIEDALRQALQSARANCQLPGLGAPSAQRPAGNGQPPANRP